jgi:protein-S-isoprenylcysteine O-methyltransferase Ste14
MKPIIPPPIILLFFIGVVFGIDAFSPFDLLLGQSRMPLVLASAGGGVLIAVLGVLQFRKHKTTINPHAIDQAKALVTGGAYRFTRNPMYLGMLLVLVGMVFYSRDALALVALPGFVVTLNRLQIRPEERALAAMFGDAFAAYCQRTRRWI